MASRLERFRKAGQTVLEQLAGHLLVHYLLHDGHEASPAVAVVSSG
jgi:hypothetical protein